MSSQDESKLWEERYQGHVPGWDIGQPAPAFMDYFKEAGAPKSGRICVPGCGRGHDALYLAELGFEVVGVDFAESPIKYCREQAEARNLQDKASFLVRDIFELLPEYAQSFDYVLEYTCFCAIPVDRRPDYVQLMRGLLKPGGKLIATFFTHNRPGGPPFKTNTTELHQLFDGFFQFERLEKPRHYAPRREGEETFGVLVSC